MTFQLPAVKNKSACKFRKKSTLAVQHCRESTVFMNNVIKIVDQIYATICAFNGKLVFARSGPFSHILSQI